MESDKISSNEDKFDFSLLNNKINSIHREIDDREKDKRWKHIIKLVLSRYLSWQIEDASW